MRQRKQVKDHIANYEDNWNPEEGITPVYWKGALPLIIDDWKTFEELW